MNVLVYLGHPAHFHLFKHCIKNLQEKHHKITIVIKSKDVLEQLLIDSKLDFINIASGKKRSLYSAFTKRLLALSKLIRIHKPNILIGSAAELAVLGKLYKIPSYIFFEDDFEAVKKFAKVTGPTATKLICPDCCSAWKWQHKKTGYKSYHELAYLHPNHFKPDVEKVKGIFDLSKKNFILRFAQLTAYHDKGKHGITSEVAQKLIDLLLPHGNVFITSERELEPQFEKYRINISPLDIHHALYYADMYVGDSQTMTAEAAVLGTPAIRFNDFVGELSYLEELEHQYELTYGIKSKYPEKLFQKTKELMQNNNLKKDWELKRKKMLGNCIDLAEYMTNLIEKELNRKNF